ncbi:histone H3.v1 isoform X1 [Octopus bimaculoides]|nr:histone H3.v1 isoform X1 [Octopus bimaculoides]|eukprot:XP_014786620.1 PREDICTED: histone H3.v1-like [Octopus bimaculoides]
MAGQEGKITYVNNDDTDCIKKIKEKTGITAGPDAKVKGDRKEDSGDKEVKTDDQSKKDEANKTKDKNDDLVGEDKMFKKPTKRLGDTPLDLTVSTSKKKKDDGLQNSTDMQNSNLMYNEEDDDEDEEEDEDEDEDEEDEEDEEDDEEEDEEDEEEEAEEET